MKRINWLAIAALLSLINIAVIGQNLIKYSIENPNGFKIIDAFIQIKVEDELLPLSLFKGDNEIPHQLIQSDNGKAFCFVLDLTSKEKIELKIQKAELDDVVKFQSRTYAELAMKTGNVYYDKRFRGDRFENVTKIKVPEIHTDHDALFKYEGPGWESEKVGYRFYLDWRNATDIFGKKVNELVLHKVGITDTVAKDDSYHSMQEWGMDIFKVGKTLGIGSIGMMNNSKVVMVSKTDSIHCEISENGPIRSKVTTDYFGWKVGEKSYNLKSDISIFAGSRLTNVRLSISAGADNLVTGFAKYLGTTFSKSDLSDQWSFISLYGNQTLVNENDKLGIAVFFKSSQMIALTEDDINHIVKLKPMNGLVEYYFAAAWEQEPNGIKNEKEFIEYLNQTLKMLNNPIIVKQN